MELIRGWGLERAVRAQGADVDASMLEAETLADAAGGAAVQVGYPSREQSRVLSPVAPACVAQDDVEPLLLAHLRARPGARVELGTAVTGVWAGADGARVALRDVTTGSLRAGPRALRRRGRRRAQHGARRHGHRDAGRRGRDGGRLDADPRAALGRRRRPPPPALLGDARRRAEPLPADRRVGPLALRGRGRRRGGGRRGADRRARPARRRRARPAGSGRAGRAASPRRPSSRSASAPARSSWPATPRIG